MNNANAMRRFEVRIWSASPQQIDNEQSLELAGLLDDKEAARSRGFRLERDRRAYVLAHGLRRLALGEALQVDPPSLKFSDRPGRKPELSTPDYPDVFFSHSHTRDVVVFALSRHAPVGIDAESYAGPAVDSRILDQFLVLPRDEAGADARASRSGSASNFYFYWTALEAFWKAAGTGLLASNPRIHCRKNQLGLFEVFLEGAASQQAQACVIPVATVPGSVLALAVTYVQPKSTGWAAASTGRPACIRSSENAHVFKCRKRYLQSSVTTIVSA